MVAIRKVPTRADVLDAIAAALDAGLTPAEALSLVARAGPASARLAQRLQRELARGMAPALRAAQLIEDDELDGVALAERAARLPSALRWVVGRARERSDRSRAIRGAVIGPLVLAALSLLAEPLPALIMGGASFRPAIVHVALLCSGAALLLYGAPRVWAHPRAAAARTLAARVPVVGALVRLDEESAVSAVVAAFAGSADLTLAAQVAQTVVAAPLADALSAAAKDPFAPLALLSEPLSLALSVGARVGDLPARVGAWHAQATQTLTARWRAVVRVAAYTLLVAVAVHSALKLVGGPLPGLGGDLNTPELRELERELEP